MINPMPQCNMFAYKPDLKKKPKPGISSGSIMKSNVPLKATIPVKKVAPMLKPSPPGTMTNSKHNLNSSIQFLNKPGKPSHTSTPMSTTTTALNTSPRYLDKPRYSYQPTTPTRLSAGIRRQTLAEPKTIKSPLKQRSPMKSRFSTALGGVEPKRSTVRLGARASVGVSGVHKQKENKKP
ncbi:uncharacterized protein LOC119671466 [Teleopsis dalmanni]|uniref:uncharacterized protein LOC119671466 n=1 Tax=Teleopsis dalmanni TaxID=139649 RepID=UPI0018CFDDF2|nr:uncharacterized protein LOC119671466 [Teleopsis dalmanni]